ncbi:MAG: hypothetical protein RI922_2888 [Bacteroidota bacterium]|jgi:hypothetical protein
MNTNIKQIEHYFSLLGIPKTASLDELKKAFRNKAKKIHPDRNPSLTAHSDFLELNEAFDFLSSFLKENKQFGSEESTIVNSYDNWEKTVKENVRKKVKEQARMSFQAYMNSEHFRSDTLIESFFTHLIFLFTVFNLFILPIVLAYHYAWIGLSMALIENVLMILFTTSAVRNLDKLNWRQFAEASLFVLKTRLGIGILLFALNTYIFITIGLYTLIPLNTLIALYFLFGSIGVGFGAVQNLRQKRSLHSSLLYFHGLSFFPTIVSLFLVLNFVFSSEPINEKYAFQSTQQYSKHGDRYVLRKTGLIELERNAYNDYTSLRSFSNHSNLMDKGNIHFTFENGLFGIKVLKEYRFEQ